MISKEEQGFYLKRLSTPNYLGESFFEQFQHGSGDELKEKFWKDKSSARMTFDLYSWMSNEDIVRDFKFERKLPAIKSYRKGNNSGNTAGVPHIDVYIETGTDIIFIESKYTEKAGLHYKGEGKKDLKPQYWNQGIYKGLSISQRFYNEEEIALMFSNFCDDIQEEIDRTKELYKGSNPWKWFNAKQETCHLFGIIFFLLDSKEVVKYAYGHSQSSLKSKRIHLYNIIWQLNGDVIEKRKHTLPAIFEEKANKLVRRCLPVEFDFNIMTVQELLKQSNFYGLDFTKAHAFLTDSLLSDYMERYNLPDKR